MRHFCECGCGQEVKNRFVRGHNWRGKKRPELSRRNLKDNPMWSPESKRKSRESHKGQPSWNKGLTKETDDRVKQIFQKCYPKMSESHKRLWQDQKFKTEALRKMRKGLRIKPTTPEQRFIEINRKYGLGFRYTGDGKEWIGSKNPDFLNGKKVVEIFSDYWHNPLRRLGISYHQTYQGTIDHYKKHGYRCTILWESEIIEGRLKINKF